MLLSARLRGASAEVWREENIKATLKLQKYSVGREILCQTNSRPIFFLGKLRIKMQTAVKEVKIKPDFRAKEISRGFLEATIGNTPLIGLRRITRDLPEKQRSQLESALRDSRAGNLVADARSSL